MKNESFIYKLRFFLIISLNIIIVSTLEYDSTDLLTVSDQTLDENSLFNLVTNNSWFSPIYFGLCFVIFVIILVEIFVNSLNKRPDSIGEEIKAKKLEEKKTNKIDGNNIKKTKKIFIIFQKYSYILNPLNFILIFISLAAIYIPWFWGVILLDVISKNKEMRDIVKSITLNSVQLLKTVFLALIVMYIYAFLAFTYFPGDYAHEEDADYKNYCHTLSSCFISTVYNGIRAGGGIGEALGHLTRDNSHYWLRLIFDLTFFIFVIICLLNIIFGIIIDTFADLRDKRNEFNDLVASKCFICEQEKFKIESLGEGWKLHTQKSHNILSYVHFFIFLEGKSINDCSGVEKTVKESISNNDYKFIPHLISKSTWSSNN